MEKIGLQKSASPVNRTLLGRPDHESAACQYKQKQSRRCHQFFFFSYSVFRRKRQQKRCELKEKHTGKQGYHQNRPAVSFQIRLSIDDLSDTPVITVTLICAFAAAWNLAKRNVKSVTAVLI
jgi:hypothetical protein